MHLPHEDSENALSSQIIRAIPVMKSLSHVSEIIRKYCFPEQLDAILKEKRVKLQKSF
jgi:hypothetical protein